MNVNTKASVKALFAAAEKTLSQFANSPGVQEQDVANGILKLTLAQQASFEYICAKLADIEVAIAMKK